MTDERFDEWTPTNANEVAEIDRLREEIANLRAMLKVATSHVCPTDVVVGRCPLCEVIAAFNAKEGADA